MAEQPGDLRWELLSRIDGRRSSIEDYLRTARPRGNRLVNVAIVSSAIAAVLTAGPALGGETFTEGVAGSLSLPSDSIIWRTLCFLALAVSVVAAISTNLSKSHDTARRIAAAESTNAELEGLRTLVEFGQIPLGEAVKLYQQYVTKIPWVAELHPAPGAWPGPPPAYGGPVPRPRPAPGPGWNPPGLAQSRPPTGPQPVQDRPDHH